MPHAARELKVRVRDGPRRVVPRHQPGGDLVREGMAPQDWPELGVQGGPAGGGSVVGVRLREGGEAPPAEAEQLGGCGVTFTRAFDWGKGGAQGGHVQVQCVREPDATHARAGGVTRTDVERHLWCELRNTRRTAGDVGREPPEVVDGVFEVAVQVHAVRRRGESLLQPRHAAGAARDGEGHAPKFPHQLLEVFFGARTAGPGKGLEHVVESLDSVRWQLNGAGDRVHQPSQDHLAGLP